MMEEKALEELAFQKIVLALVKFGKNLGIDLNSLITTVKINNKIRSKYKELDSRESEQNVSFNDKI